MWPLVWWVVGAIAMFASLFMSVIELKLSDHGKQASGVLRTAQWVCALAGLFAFVFVLGDLVKVCQEINEQCNGGEIVPLAVLLTIFGAGLFVFLVIVLMARRKADKADEQSTSAN